jgi:hypothetical protein
MEERKEVGLGQSPTGKSNLSEPQKLDQSEVKKPKLKNDATSKEVLDFFINTDPEEFLPWEEITLPSMGKFYNGRIPEGKVEVRPMGLTADKILSTVRLVQSGKALNKIFSRYVRFPDKDFDPINLLVGDRTFLLFYLRAITHGNMYEFVVRCTNDDCGQQSEHEYDLNDLAGSIQYTKHESEPIRVDLPFVTKKLGKPFWVDVRFMRGHDLKILEERRRMKEKLSGRSVRNIKTKKQNSIQQDRVNSTLEDSLHLLVVGMNGVEDRNVISKGLAKLSSSDIQAINTFLGEDSPGVDLEVGIKCPHCDQEMRMDLPLTETFFRPKVSRRV